MSPGPGSACVLVVVNVSSNLLVAMVLLNSIGIKSWCGSNHMHSSCRIGGVLMADAHCGISCAVMGTVNIGSPS